MAEDGSLNVHISRDRRYGESSMMAFVKQHMGEILRPFAENVDRLNLSLENLKGDLNLTSETAHEALDEHIPQGKFIQSVRDDLTATQRQAAAIKPMLERMAAKSAKLQADSDEQKLHVAGMHARLMDTVAHVDKLQHGHDTTNNTLSGVSSKLQETREHLKYGVEVQLEKQGNNLQNLEAAHQATIQLLASTTQFVDRFNEEFNVSKQRQADLNSKNEHQFECVDSRLKHLSTMLTETINRLNTQANHLRSTNTSVRPLGEKLDALADSHYKLQRQCMEMSNFEQALQQSLSDSDQRIRQLNGQLGEAEMSKNNMGAGLNSALGGLTVSLQSVQDSLSKHQEVLPAQDKRMLKLETKNVRLMEDIKVLQEHVGVGPGVTSSSRQVQVPQPVGVGPEFTSEPSSRQVQVPQPAAGGGLSGVAMQMNARARLAHHSKQLEDHDQEIAAAHNKLQAVEKDMKRKDQRIDNLENKLELLSKDISETKQGLELTEEWWKGLSQGFRETYRSVSVEKELLPSRPGTALSTTTTQSGGPSRPVSARPMSRRPSKEHTQRETRDRRIQLASLDVA